MARSRVVRSFPYIDQEKAKEACAAYLKVSPSQISQVDVVVDGGGHYMGLQVLGLPNQPFIDTDRQVGKWVEDHLPN